jgi:uncharacterized protein (DUF1697 family)
MSEETWAVLLRGINVGGQRPVPMVALRDALRAQGYVDPETYIQSGNVVLGSRRPKGARTAQTIGRRLSETFGHDIRVVVRTLPEMTAIVRRIPKDWDVDDRSMRPYVVFLTDALDARGFVRGVRTDPDVDVVTAGPHAIYWTAPVAMITRSRMTQLAGTPAYAEMTIRNLRTTLKIHAMMRARVST